MEPSSRRVPLDKRKRTETSCDRCKARKQKCDRQLDRPQCRYCELHDIACTTTAPRKRRMYGSVEGLGSRITLLESLVKGLLPEADLSSMEEMLQLGKTLGILLPSLEETSNGDHDIDKTVVKNDEENAMQIIPDQQNQNQYVGPASSFLFHLKLRRMLGNYPIFKFAMFGSNAADQVADISNVPAAVPSLEFERRESSNGTTSDCGSPSGAIRDIDGTIIETLIDAYFDVIHSDFPILHEPSFREAYEVWSHSKSSADPAWLCGVLCVLILSRRIAPVEIPEDAEKKWWKHVQTLLPTVIFSSSIHTVQALMLAALHLHNNNHRDACWNLTGTAVRVAHAIGMHRDDIKHVQSPLGRELRKQLWWTLYAFEHMQVSSYDRPSAIAHVASTVGCPSERIIGTAGHFPPEFTKWSQKLYILLGTACKALNPAGNGGTTSPEDAYSRPLSPTAAIIRDLERWKAGLPPHLRLEVLSSLAPAAQRPLILLYVQYYYILTMVTRSALLRRATLITSPETGNAPAAALITVSETCIEAGRSLGRLLRKLDNIHKFNAVTWFDIFYLVASALVLVLDLRIKQDEDITTSESRVLLKDLSGMAAKHLQNPRMPGSMRAFAQIVTEVYRAAERFGSSSSEPQPELMLPPSIPMSEIMETPRSAILPNHQGEQFSPRSFDSAATFGNIDFELGSHGITSLDDHTYDAQFWAQLAFMDEPQNALQDWRWDDIESIVRSK